MPEVAAPQPSIDDDKRQEFHIEEFKTLKSEIAANILRSTNILQYVILGSAALYSFLMGFGEKTRDSPLHVPPPALTILWLIPSSMTLIGSLVCITSLMSIKVTGRYLLELEKTVGIKNLGWESFFANENKKRSLTRLFTQSGAAGIAWGLLLFLNFTAAFFGLHTIAPSATCLRPH